MIARRIKNSRSPYSRVLFYTILLSVIGLALAIRLAYAADNSTLDDAYITFRYVRNLARGLGLVFNPGERVLGTTTPLFVLLLVPFQWGGADILLVSKMITLLASTANVVLVFLIARQRFGDWSALFGACLLAISTTNIWAASTGMETEFNVLVLLLTAYLYERKHPKLAGLFAAFAVLTRADDLIFVSVLFGWYLIQAFTERADRRAILESIVWFGLVLFPWTMFAVGYYGSPIPNSIIGKAVSYRVPVADNWLLFIDQFGFALGTPRAAVSSCVFLLGVGQILRQRNSAMIYPIFFAVYSVAFIMTGARLGSGWYWQPLWPAYCVIFSAGIDKSVYVVAHTRAWKIIPGLVQSAIVALAIGVTVLIFAQSAKVRFLDQRPPKDNVVASLESAGRWLHQYSPVDATVAAESIGAVAWYSDRRILDEGGLVSPQVTEINARAGTHDFFTIIQTLQPDYYLAWASGELDQVTATAEQSTWFNEHYERVISFGAKEQSIFVLFKKVDQ